MRGPIKSRTAVDADRRVNAVRRFNRFYTRQIGALRRRFLDSPFPLAEARIYYELAHREQPTASDLANDLGLDAGYLSRMIRAFEQRGHLTSTRSDRDGRRSVLALTLSGREVFRAIDRRQHGQIAKLLTTLRVSDRRRLLDAMRTIEDVLGAKADHAASLVIRAHRPGDIGWVVHRHGLLYAQEFGWDERFEALVAEIVARFISKFDPTRERCMIAELDGEIAGSIFLVTKSASVAQLRLLLVEPSARGHGIGHRLVRECIEFARSSKYRKIVLWTNSVLHAARHIYEQAGFRLVREERHASFGKSLIGQNWELTL
jgi:DNA-binding MarR family transcriptional regulator/GNAT superfamily N-acetyltransferase